MKKMIAFLLVFALCASFAACSKQAKAFDISKEAYENINAAYELVNKFSEDIYEAWNMGINNKASIDGKDEGSTAYSYDDSYNDLEALETFANELHIPQADLEAAVAKLLGKDHYDPGSYDQRGDWYTLSSMYYASFFSACVDLVSTAYEVNGTAAEITELLEEAMDQMKTLSNKYADYEHYPNLKEYFTNTTAFFGFCLEPEGSFDQVVDTFNEYRNNARNYFYDLNYVFEDSIFPKKEEEENGDKIG